MTRPDASMFAEQHQIDPDEAYRDAVYAEISEWLATHWPAIILGTAFGLCLIALPAIVLVRL